MKAEIARRQSLTDALDAFLRANPGRWLTMRELAEVGGFGGWRTRLSECGRLRGMHVEWNGRNGSESCHRYLPNPLGGRDAGTWVDITAPLPLLPDAHPGPYQR